jgi:hypothetical protein
MRRIRHPVDEPILVMLIYIEVVVTAVPAREENP